MYSWLPNAERNMLSSRSSVPSRWRSSFLDVGKHVISQRKYLKILDITTSKRGVITSSFELLILKFTFEMENAVLQILVLQWLVFKLSPSKPTDFSSSSHR